MIPFAMRFLVAQPLELHSKRKSDDVDVQLTIRFVGDMAKGDEHYIQFFNIIMRKCLEYLRLQLVGRNYFDAQNQVKNWKYSVANPPHTDHDGIFIFFMIFQGRSAPIPIVRLARLRDFDTTNGTRYSHVCWDYSQSYASANIAWHSQWLFPTLWRAVSGTNEVTNFTVQFPCLTSQIHVVFLCIWQKRQKNFSVFLCQSWILYNSSSLDCSFVCLLTTL